MNYHIEITFRRWSYVGIARIRRLNATSPPAAVRDHFLQSEDATLVFLEQTQVPATKVQGHSLEQSDNPVGVGYILMGQAPGQVSQMVSHEPSAGKEDHEPTRRYLY
ncbi:hypothetical protein AAL_02729 [Moelleriella libera RCEF 2490]|uniref:Uncharacterized protein n=1 Tax=Moelleriella libera RCEF 2490 TaxID=1081109 RepID=A0A168EV32_9HYPO|nr:hypothetical protein AAL_02729 [Moelleriella libera RCEF 2490]